MAISKFNNKRSVVPPSHKSAKPKRKVSTVLIKWILPLVILLIIWEIISLFSRTPMQLLGVAEAFLRLVIEGDAENQILTTHIGASLYRVLLGFLLAILTAFPLGIAIGRYRAVDATLGPVVDAIRPIPPIAWIPLSIVIFQNILASQVFIIWVGAFFPILINTTTGVKRTEPVHIDVARTFGSSERQILAKVIIPSAAPEVFAGLRIGFGIGWMCLVAAEMISASLGLGYLVIIMQQAGRTGEVISSMLVIGLIGFLFSYFFMTIEHKLLRWRQEISV